MKLFSEDQRKILRSLWIPGLFLSLCFFLRDVVQIKALGKYDHYVAVAISLSLTYAWEFLYTRQWKNAGIILVAGFALCTRFIFMRESAVYIYPLLQYVQLLIMVGLRWYLTGRPYDFRRLFTLALFLTIMPYFSYSLSGIVSVFHGETPLWLRVLYNLADGIPFVLAVYVTLFLFENKQRDPAFADRLRSKIAVTGGKEFALVYFVYYTLFLACVFSISVMLAGDFWRYTLLPGVNTWYRYSCFFYNLTFPFFYLCYGAWMLRNIVMCRMTTSNAMNRIYCLLAAIPVLNLIPFFVLMAAHDEESNEAVNAYRYLYPRLPVLRVMLILAGITSALRTYALFHPLWRDNYSAMSIIIMVVFCCIVLKLVLYTMLYYYDLMLPIALLSVVEVLAIGIIMLAKGGDSREALLVILPPLFIPVIYYFYREIFHPALHGRDAQIAQQYDLAPAITDDPATSTQH